MQPAFLILPQMYNAALCENIANRSRSIELGRIGDLVWKHRKTNAIDDKRHSLRTVFVGSSTSSSSALNIAQDLSAYN